MPEHVTLALLYVAQLLPRDDTDKTRYISISPSDLSKFNVEGQIMLVKHSQSPIDHAEVIQWSGKFVPGKACEPVNHRLFPNVSGELDACDGDTAGQVQQERSVSMSLVWEYPVEELAVLIDVLFRGHCKEDDKENGNKRTSSTVSQVIKERFPYSSEDGRLLLESARAREEIVAKLDVLCYQCNAETTPQKLRAHVGAHILAYHYQTGIPKAQKPVGKHYPCGFCGREDCTLLLKASRSGKTPQASSDCPSFQSFQQLSALKSKECSNAPVRCKEVGCEQVHWKYNMRYHYEYAHVGTPMPAKYRIGREELVRMKVMTKGKKRAASVLSGSSDEGESRTVETVEGKRRRKYTKKGAAMMKE
ncbi:hypothetical protein CNBK3380 [Cryptococcus deneoformans B-3501A]|uniref:hypothetical protein n=1 Tax=Cryptococcus deneoformans (strain B-3501A) TaxID=283643 RepID=UPI000042F0A1|nr:hypothetical protein CNBK3380 [Cryptococcus neoformans var. neoformans B-3501A]EAL17987.1 hypothetical protein CNBK3380 [Cryptococcus neoformans var. neoformans B-3501A]